MMLCFCACRPLILDLACCSLRMMKGRPYSSKTMDMVAALWGRRSGLRLSGNSATACSEDFSTRKRCRRVRLLACQRSVAALTIERSCLRYCLAVRGRFVLASVLPLARNRIRPRIRPQQGKAVLLRWPDPSLLPRQVFVRAGCVAWPASSSRTPAWHHERRLQTAASTPGARSTTLRDQLASVRSNRPYCQLCHSLCAEWQCCAAARIDVV